MMDSSNHAVSTENLCKNYREIAAVHKISVDIPENVILGLIGRNGSGKTTFLRLCAGQLEKTSGKINVFGEEPMNNLSVLEKLIYSTSNYQFGKTTRILTILRNFYYMFQQFDIEFAKKLLDYFSLSLKKIYGQMSLGETSLFNFICALATRSPLTMLDEPILGMDTTIRSAVYEILLRDYNENPRTFIISSHLLSEIEGLLSDIMLIDKGALVLCKNIDELRSSAYKVEGSGEALDKFLIGRESIFRKNGGLTNYAVINSHCLENDKKEIAELSLTLSAVRPEELCFLLTSENKDSDMDKIWQ